MIEFFEHNDKNGVSVERIEKLEAKVQFSLDFEYKEFLLTYNGGKPVPNTSVFFNLEIDVQEKDVAFFLGFYAKREVDDISYWYDKFIIKDHLEYLPIAMTYSQDHFFIKLSNPNKGVIFFREDAIEESHYSMNKMIIAAPSFKSWISLFKPF